MAKRADTQKWGQSTADKRYGAIKNSDIKPKDQSRPQSPEDRQGATYSNDTADNWLRGYGKRRV